MKKIQILGLALFAVFAFGAIAAASAFAASEWEVEGAKVTGALPAETEGLLSLIKLISATNHSTLVILDCEGIFDGVISTVGKDEITALLNLAMELIGTLGGLALSCAVTFTKSSLEDCNSGSTASVWPDNLPWVTQLELMEPSGKILDKLFGNGTGQPGYDVECLDSIGIAGSELCEGATSAEVTNGTETPMGVVGTFGTASESELANCTETGEKSSELEGSGPTWAVGGTVAAPEQLNRLDTLVTP